ncbi:DUF262 domain-containing protein [Flavobacterium sp. N2270]|uniref:DUF262 domain-containing protein n=1 Tax=Flavobacterium sp. N2270 TaxID=2986831 RepID=UPI002224714E|nr:DUF262 domain-containing protein [Flavobacterium sp. N2270]
MNKNLDLLPITELLNKNFYVPSYQRGYRWTKKEVKALLDDILQFFLESQDRSSEAFYCLQPLVVTNSEGKWVLVDGQQRLTTIYLILRYLKAGMEFLGKQTYSITYETRIDSEEFLKTMDREKRYENIDYFHMSEAYDAIEQWFGEHDGSYKNAILNTLLNDRAIGKNVKIIWYEISEKDEVDIFTRINMGKIPLTNAELIKALFLSKDNLNLPDIEQFYLKQIEIASEWDKIENTLQDDNFWYFIHDNETKYDTRIEFIFDLIKDKKTFHDDYYTFVKYQEELIDKKNSPKIWLSVKEYFMKLEEWYTDRTLYHLIGFLITTGTKVNELFDKSLELSKIEFKNLLYKKIKAKFKGVELDELVYGDGHIKNILLLFNIETMLQNIKSNSRFPFDEYKKENWDIEHISSVMSDIPSLKQSKNWLHNILEYFTGNTVLDFVQTDTDEANEMVKSVKKLLINDNYTLEEFTKVYNKVISYFKEDYQTKSDSNTSFTNTISNLTLLDSHTNRSYKNAVFPVKRKRILNNDMDGYFVPLCTKNVFLKCYSEKLDGMLFWQKSDANNYLENIKKTLKVYFN